MGKPHQQLNGKFVRAQYDVAILPSPNNDWNCGGFQYADSVVRLGRNVELLRQPSFEGGEPPEKRKVNQRLGGLILASVGYEPKEIGPKLKENQNHIRDQLSYLMGRFGVSRSYMLFPGALRHGIFEIERFGPQTNFRASDKDLIKLGLLATVEREFVLAAYDQADHSLRAEMQRMGHYEGTHGLSGSITAAMVTRQLSAISCFPLVPDPGSEKGVKPGVPVEEWKAAIRSKSKEEFVERFSELQLAIADQQYVS